MKVTVGQLRRIIREVRVGLSEDSRASASSQQADFGTVLDSILQDLYNTNKKVEKAHELAPQGPAKAIVAGIHSDLFNKVAEIRKYAEQLKKLARQQRAEGRTRQQ